MTHLESASPLTGSFDPAEVTYLLDDIGPGTIETSADERRPSARYLRVVDRMIERRAEPIAALVSRVGHLLAGGDRPLVLVSIAPAGCPIGILLRRYLHIVEGQAVPHVAASVIEGHGLDPAAARWIAAAHPEAEAVYVDGWTGMGVIADEVAAPAGRFVALVDPAGRADVCGTTSDELVPSACLDVLSQGMVSRTVLNPDRPNGFDGARSYGRSQLDRSNVILDTITRHLRLPADPTVVTSAQLAEQRRGAEAAVDAAARTWTAGDVRRIRPGIGEAIRMLLRGAPQLLLVRDLRDLHAEPLLVLADELRVPVAVDASLYWRALAIIE